MRTTTTESGWKRAMLHAWLGFLLLLAFYVMSFGIPGRVGNGRGPKEKERVEAVLPEGSFSLAEEKISLEK